MELTDIEIRLLLNAEKLLSYAEERRSSEYNVRMARLAMDNIRIVLAKLGPDKLAELKGDV